jgi:hypothetical protein
MISLLKRAVFLVAALVALGGVSAPSLAQDAEIAPEHLALARKYVDLTDKSGIYELSLVETAVNTMKQLVSQNPNIAKPVDDAITKTLDFYRGKKGDLMDQFARVYALNFSQEELTQIVAFYESPVGQKLSEANAALNDSLKTVMSVFEVNLRQEFFAKVRAELKAAGVDT